MKLKTFKFTEDDIKTLEDVKQRFGIRTDSDAVRRALVAFSTPQHQKEQTETYIPTMASQEKPSNPFIFEKKSKDHATGEWFITARQAEKPWHTTIYLEGSPEFNQMNPDATTLGDITYEKTS